MKSDTFGLRDLKWPRRSHLWSSSPPKLRSLSNFRLKTTSFVILECQNWPPLASEVTEVDLNSTMTSVTLSD